MQVENRQQKMMNTPINFQKVEARAIFLQDLNTKQEHIDLEEYEFDITWSHHKQKFIATLQDGKYLITVKVPGFKEFNEVQYIKQNNSKFQWVLEKLEDGVCYLNVVVVDALS